MIGDFYTMDLKKINAICDTFTDIIKTEMPVLYEKLLGEGVMVLSFLFEWTVTMYSSVFPLELSFKVWDNILFYGDFYILKVALSIFEIINEKSG